MTVELLQTLSIAAYIAAGVLLMIAVALFFILDIIKLYGDVSGRTAKKAIEAIRQQNESTGNKAYKPSAVNAERGKITDKISSSGHLQTKREDLSVSVGTEKIDPLTAESQTSETTILEQSIGETTVLIGDSSPDSKETSLLINDNIAKVPHSITDNCFSVIIEMCFTESSEIIE